MTTMGVDILTSLDLKDADGNDLVGNVEEAFINGKDELRRLPDPEPLLEKLKLAHRGFDNWNNTLTNFSGSEEQGVQMRSRRAAALGALQEVFTMADRIGSTTTRRAKRELDDLIESVGALINVFPEARQQHLNNVGLDDHEPQPYYMNPAPTTSEPSQSPPGASRADTLSPTRTMSSDPQYIHRFDRVKSDQYAKMIAGNWVRDPGVYTAATDGKGNWYNEVIALDSSCMIVGDVFGGDSPFGTIAPAQPTAAAPPPA